MKTVADTLGVARSNLVEHVHGPPGRRQISRKADDAWVLPLIRAIVDEPAHRWLSSRQHC
jgi:hypothetical protein